MNQKQRAAKIRTPCEHETSSAEQSSEDISSLNNIKDKSKFKRGQLKIMIIVVYVQRGTLDFVSLKIKNGLSSQTKISENKPDCYLHLSMRMVVRQW